MIPLTNHSRRGAGRRRLALQRALATLLAVASAAACAPTALAVGNGVLASSAPVVHPETKQPVDSWSLVGYGSNSATQIAPRWVLAAEHSQASGGIQTATRGSSGAVGTWVPRGASGGRLADISLTLLERPLPAPQSGWPKLLDDDLSELAAVLPGQVLYAGLGGVAPEERPYPKVGWASAQGVRPAGEPALGAIGGDSGGTALWHPTAGSRPVIAHVAVGARTRWTLANQLQFSTRFGQSPVGSSATTVGEWVREIIAAHPEAEAPTWTTVGEEVDYGALRPVAPTGFHVAAASDTQMTLAWSHPKDPHVARLRYRLSRPGYSVTLPPTTSRHTVRGLTVGTEYTWTLRAENANGASPDPLDGGHVVSFTTRTPPGPVENLRIQPYRAVTSGRADYCHAVSWTAPLPVAGTEITDYTVTMDGTTDVWWSEEEDGRYVARQCGLQPGSFHSFAVRSLSDVVVSRTTRSTGMTTLTGAPLGTVVPAPTNLTATPRLATITGKVDHCIDFAWTPAADEIDGFQLQSYTVSALDLTTWNVTELPVGAHMGKASICGLEPNRVYWPTLTSVYGSEAWDWLGAASTKTIDGAPTGTPLPAATGLTWSSRANGATWCATVRWTPPTAPRGVTISSYRVVLQPVGGGTSYVTSIGSPTATSIAERCSLPAGISYRASVAVTYSGGGRVGAPSVTIPAPN